jgi:predicted metal-dependent hydrolase
MPEIEYDLIRSRRKTISIMITQDAAVVVRAPLRAPLRVIDGFVKQKREWIREKHAQALKRREAHKPREYISGEELPYLGSSLVLAVTDSVRRVELLGGTLALPKAKAGDAGRLLVKWYVERAREFIATRVEAYAARTGIHPASVSITGARRRWGSCSASGRLNFAWRLVMAPPDVVDYVVVHELAHIEHHDHSRAFWDRVGEILPDYKAKRKWLKDNGVLLQLL